MLKIIKHITLVLFITLFFFTTLTCKKSSPVNPAGNNKIIFTFEDASCTEAWFNLKINDLQFPVIVDLYKDNFLNKSLNVFGSTDTTFYIEDLLPKKKYEVYVKVKSNNGEELTSERINFETMDTTSHNFTWQSWEFGTIGSSTLYDVAIIDENDIWAVGEINIADTSINGYTTYNAVHWDGTKWELKRIYFPTVCGGTGLSSYPAKAIFAFNDGQIWISTSGDKIAILKDGIQINKFCLPSNVSMSINKLWGSSSEDLYAVGNNGNIAHWDGRKWTKIESGTNLHIYDIWGDYNERIGQWEILAVAADVYNSFEKEVIAIKNSQSYKLSNFGIEEPLMGVWFKCNRKYYLVGSGTYMKTFLSDKEWKGNPRDITNYFENAIRANSTNDVIVVGAFGEVLHFNGYNWKSFINQTHLPLGTYLSVDVNGKILVAVGWNSRQAIITIGKK
jgi:hypothetical protein